METTKFASQIFGLLLLASCDNSNRVYENDCKIPPANWATEADHNRRLENGGVVSPNYNVIDLNEAGRLNWNGYPINRAKLETYLNQVDNFDPAPMTILQIDYSTRCSDVEDVRKILLRSATCQRLEKLCTEVNPDPPPPPEKEADKITDTKDN